MNISKQKNHVAAWNNALQESRGKLKGFQDRYYGKRCFIIGNGPSLNYMDWSFLKNEYTFGLNKIYLLYNKMKFEPTFYMCINPLVIEQSIEEIYNITSEKFLPSKHIQLVEQPKGINFFEISDNQFFSKNASEVISTGYTVTHTALQMAYYMGFRQVVLVGVDHYFQFSGLPNTIVVSEGDDPNHFDPNYFGAGLRWQLPDLKKSEISYTLAKNAFEADGRVVLDGTIDGRLTVFPKINYKDIFKVDHSLNKVLNQSSLPAPSLSNYQLNKQTFLPDKRYKVSAVVSTYNSKRYIAECLQDLENQSISSEMEIIVIDSGSQQNEADVVIEFQKKYDNIRYIRTEQRETIYQAWNRGIQMARGKYITNANTDDRHTSDALEKMVDALNTHPDWALVYADQHYFIENNDGGRDYLYEQKRGGGASRRLYEECYIGSQPMWRKSIHSEFGYFDEFFSISGDYEFWLRINQKYSFGYINEFLGERLVRKDSLEYGNFSHDTWYETGTLLKCYKYALLHNIIIKTEGLSNNPIFKNWCEVNILIKNTQEKMTGKRYKTIRTVIDRRRLNQKPKISIVITTYNREKDLRDTLNELNNQNEKDFDVIVVNNGTEMNTFSSFPLNLSYDLCLIEMKENYGPSLARNIGVEHARGEIIAILDDDAIARHDWVENILCHFNKEAHIVALRGKVLPKNENIYDHIPSNYNLGDDEFFNTVGIEMNSAFRRCAFLNQSGFDEHLWFHEGIDFSYRIWKSHDEALDVIMYFPDVVIYHDFSANPDHLLTSRIRITENSRLLNNKWSDFKKYAELTWSVLPKNKEADNFNFHINASKFCHKKNPRLSTVFAIEASRISPLDARSYNIAGSTYFKLGEIENSIVSFEIAFELLQSDLLYKKNGHPVDIETAYLTTALKLIYLYLKIGKYMNASKIFRKINIENKLLSSSNDLNNKRNQILSFASEVHPEFFKNETST